MKTASDQRSYSVAIHDQKPFGKRHAGRVARQIPDEIGDVRHEATVALEATRLRNTPEGAVASGVGDQGDHPAAALSVPFEQELVMQAEDQVGIDRPDRLVT